MLGKVRGRLGSTVEHSLRYRTRCVRFQLCGLTHWILQDTWVFTWCTPTKASDLQRPAHPPVLISSSFEIWSTGTQPPLRNTAWLCTRRSPFCTQSVPRRLTHDDVSFSYPLQEAVEGVAMDSRRLLRRWLVTPWLTWFDFNERRFKFRRYSNTSRRLCRCAALGSTCSGERRDEAYLDRGRSNHFRDDDGDAGLLEPCGSYEEG